MKERLLQWTVLASAVTAAPMVQGTCLDRVLAARDQIESNITGRLEESARSRLDVLLLALCDGDGVGRPGDTVLEEEDRTVHTSRGLKRQRSNDGLYVDEAPYFFGVEIDEMERSRDREEEE